MTVHVPALAPATLAATEPGESSAEVRARVDAARRRHRERYRKLPGVFCNAHVSGRWLETHTRIDPKARAALVTAADRLGFSARAYHRVMRVARTVADLEGVEAVQAEHVAVGVRYRSLAAGRTTSGHA